MTNRLAAQGLLIDGRAVETEDPAELRHALLGTTRTAHAEIWLTLSSGPAMALLKSGERALCLFVRGPGCKGFTSRRPLREKRDRETAELEFRTAAGTKCDRFPADWTVPYFLALRAADEFLRTGELPAQIRWHDDDKRPALAKPVTAKRTTADTASKSATRRASKKSAAPRQAATAVKSPKSKP